MFQRVTLIGHVGQEPQMRYTPDGTPVTTFSVATKSTLSKERFPECPNGWKESYNGRNWELTTWWRVTAWRQLAETVNQYLNKGMQVFVEGEVKGEAANGSQNPRVWVGNDGVARASYELTARTVKFLGSRAEGEGIGAGPVGEPPPEGFEEDTLPF
jgi:single-strand DNA-binding protein